MIVVLIVIVGAVVYVTIATISMGFCDGSGINDWRNVLASLLWPITIPTLILRRGVLVLRRGVLVLRRGVLVYGKFFHRIGERLAGAR